ncbi:hypothetical protein ACJMK2_012395 [Sinanodonta woodiana]|uniref:3-beta hydroxysteroid dehydrogenase/isomerase domain-containing protein n=1 Tax=Sinanodonta woodiana TaxID=1069815 RepID=A0ABD3VB36_SINWO
MATENGDVVMVTGGAGFLGHHIVHLLQTRADYVKEIRVLDIKEFDSSPCKGFVGDNAVSQKRVKSIVGSVTDRQTVLAACKDVDSVFHVAGLITYGTFPDYEGMRNVNVRGTENVISACLEAGVKRIIFCSTVDVVVGSEEIVDGTEENTHPPEKFLFPGYPNTKYEAECLIRKVNGATTAKGNLLHTICIRANVMYGEGDPYYLLSGLKAAHNANGVLHRVGDGKALFQAAYVGNTAWVFICADKALKQRHELGGEVFYTPDDTLPQNTFDFMEPYLKARGYRLSSYRLPYWLAYGSLRAAEGLVKIISPFTKKDLPAQSYSVQYINMNIHFRNTKAKEMLGFTPLFTPEEAKERSMHYYKNVNLD